MNQLLSATPSHKFVLDPLLFFAGDRCKLVEVEDAEEEEVVDEVDVVVLVVAVAEVHHGVALGVALGVVVVGVALGAGVDHRQYVFLFVDLWCFKKNFAFNLMENIVVTFGFLTELFCCIWQKPELPVPSRFVSEKKVVLLVGTQKKMYSTLVLACVGWASLILVNLECRRKFLIVFWFQYDLHVRDDINYFCEE